MVRARGGRDSLRCLTLPDPYTPRTPLPTLKISFPIYLMFNSQRRIEIKSGKPPVNILPHMRVTKSMLRKLPHIIKDNPIRTALHYKDLKDRGLTVSEIAGNVGVTRIRIYQCLKLLTLDKRIIDYFLNLKDGKVLLYWTERRLRKLFVLGKDEQWGAVAALK